MVMPAPVPGPDELGFLAAIKAADWADDAPRLVYADWLEDHDQHDRAAFVRRQVARADLLTNTPGLVTPTNEERLWLTQWLGKLPRQVIGRFQRGLIHARMRPGAFFTRRWGQGLAH